MGFFCNLGEPTNKIQSLRELVTLMTTELNKQHITHPLSRWCRRFLKIVSVSYIPKLTLAFSAPVSVSYYGREGNGTCWANTPYIVM